MLSGGDTTLRAQPPSADATFRAGTQEVLVDAVVVDKKGNFQRDLTQQDFKIWEDGKEQKITSFVLQSAGVTGHSSKHFSGVAYREDGSVAVRVGDTVELDFEMPAQLAAFLKVPYHFAKQFDIAPGRYRFRMAVGSGGQSFGVAEKLLEIEPWSGQTTSISGIALSMRDYALTGVTAGLDNSTLEGPRRLASKGRVIVPMGGSQFPAGRNGIFYFEVYEPGMVQAAGGEPAKPPVLHIRIVDRATGEEKNDSGPMETGGWIQVGNPVIPIALNLPASELPVGSYSLEVRVTHEDRQDSVVRRADFDVK